MEDSVRFLYMAGGILVGILVLSLGLYLFANFATGAASVHGEVTEEQIANFNNPYISYEGKSGVTIYDVVNLAKRARDYNEQNGLQDVSNPAHISLIVYDSKRNFERNTNGTDLTDVTRLQDDNKLIEDYLIKFGRDKVYGEQDPADHSKTLYLPEFFCPNEGIDYAEGGKIKSVKFYKNS